MTELNRANEDEEEKQASINSTDILQEVADY